VAERLLAIGCAEVSIADTIGRATPDEVERLLDFALRRLPSDQIAMHFHDTTGQAIDNIRVSWNAGISRFDSSVGGLGGCPFAPGAPGNVASEQVVRAFAAKNVAAGIDLDSLTATATWICDVLVKDEHAPH
jgi:hydroxymethylglutaryl-CoA lyase